MVWQENLFQNLLTVAILGSLVITVYCKMTKKTLIDFIKEIREAMVTPVDDYE